MKIIQIFDPENASVLQYNAYFKLYNGEVNKDATITFELEII